MGTITIEPLGHKVGAEVRGVDAERLNGDDEQPGALLKAVEEARV